MRRLEIQVETCFIRKDFSKAYMLNETEQMEKLKYLNQYLISL